MAARVFLHVGSPKSGTTYLQSVLWANKEHLQRLGLLVPGADQFDAFYATMNVRDITREEGLPARALNAWQRLVAEATAWDGDAVISHEFFAAATRRQARGALQDLAPAEVHVVMTVRDYVSQMPALWQESVKVGSNATFDEFVQRMLDGQKPGPLGWGGVDVVAVLGRWTRDLDPRHVHVVTVPPAGSPRDLLWQRFGSVLGLPTDAVTIPQSRRNESLGAVEAELLRQLNPRLKAPLGRPGAPHYRWIRRYLAEDVLVSRGGRRFGVGPAAARQLRERSVDAAAHIDRAGFTLVGSLSDLTSEPVDGQRTNPSSASEAELLEAALDTIAELVDRQRRDARAARRAARPEGAGHPARSIRGALGRVRSRLPASVRTSDTGG